VWNPFDVTDGRDPEPVEKVLRNAPEAYRARQLRAVTLADYRKRAEEVPGVSRAVARYAWTGSWRTVRLVIDPVGTVELAPELRDAVAAHLEAVRLIGEDLEIRPPRLVPLEIDLVLCLRPDVWPEDVRFVLEQELSDGWTPDGRRGFFHPDLWTFGQPLHRSQLEGRVQAVAGVDHVLSLEMKRYGAPTPGTPDPERLEVRFDEIVLVRNDPDHLERGTIRIELRGGRR
jgi:predicted phage baseplate assembly protein